MGRRRGKQNNTLKRNPPSRPPPSYKKEIISSFNSMRLSSTGLVTFEALGLSADILKGIHSYGLERPSPIQERAIPPITKGRDVILQAQSGMGKTAAFCIGILERIDFTNRNTQAIVLAPTRELAQQIHAVFEDLAGFTEINIAVCIGGSRSLRQNRKELTDYDNHIIVGTLGRVLSLIKERLIQLATVNTLVLDEADKMITDRSFVKDLEKIINVISGDAQIISASATMPSKALEVTKSIMRNPVKFLVNKEELTLEGIKQFYINVDDEQAKVETLRDLHPIFSMSHTIIFCSTRKKVKWLSEVLVGENIGKIATMTGDLSQTAREAALMNFRTGANRVLITSDLLGRGVDVHQLYAVINYDLPMLHVDYIHRVGRGGRFGRKGIAINLVTAKELERLQGIAAFYQTDIRELETDLKNLF